jgi:hypothetical protein
MLARLIEKFHDQQQLHRIEGRAGLIMLAKTCRAIGYKDPSYYGQMASGACIGDITTFIEDNPGAIEALVEWIGKQRSPEWKASLLSNVDIELEEDEDR